jgi:hypothetical protein
MMGARSAFPKLDTCVHDTIKFEDGVVVWIEGCGTVIFSCRNREHRSISGIYCIHKLKANIIGVGNQLDEVGHQVYINSGVMRIKDAEGRLLTKTSRTQNRLYVLNGDITHSVCLLMRGGEAWRWHACLEHLNFPMLKKMANLDWVCGLPRI